MTDPQTEHPRLVYTSLVSTDGDSPYPKPLGDNMRGDPPAATTPKGPNVGVGLGAIVVGGAVVLYAGSKVGLSWSLPTPEGWGLVLLSVADVPNFLAGMAPSLYTLRHMTGKSGLHQQEAQETMRRAYWVGGTFSVAVGLGASLVLQGQPGSAWPLTVTLATLAVLIYQYQWALTHPHESAEEMFKS